MGRKQGLGEIWNAGLLASPASKEMAGPGRVFSLPSSATSLHTLNPPPEAATASQLMTSPLSTTSWKTERVTPKESDFLFLFPFYIWKEARTRNRLYITPELSEVTLVRLYSSKHISTQPHFGF